jgi:predicted nuclease of restriction endonuclease-like (RecB) superfamily
VNTQLIDLYWSIGRTILERQATDGWGSGVIGRLAEDLGAEFPDMTGLSRSNLQYMRSFAGAWPAFDANVPQPLGHLPWGHIRTILDKRVDPEARDWYAAAAVEYGWSRNVLMNMIMNKTLNAPGRRRRPLCNTLLRRTQNSPNRLPKTPTTLNSSACPAKSPNATSRTP